MNEAAFQEWVLRARSVRIEAELSRRGAKLRRASKIEFVGPCPRCGGTDRFGINIQKQVFRCRQCAPAGGDVIELVKVLDGRDFLAACRTLAQEDRPVARELVLVAQAEANRNAQEADQLCSRIWDEAEPRMDAAPAEFYLRERLKVMPGISESVMRFHARLWHKETKRHMPGIVALFRDIRTDQPCGIHRTFLNDDGCKIDRKMLGRAKGAAIKLDADEAVTLGLTIGEGVETCLAARLSGFQPVWCVGSDSGIASFPTLAGLEAITILGEVGDGGANDRAARTCAARWTKAGKEALLVMPLVGKDLNDVWRDTA